VEETAKIASEFGATLEVGGEEATVVGLYGELGAGKTTFMKYLAESFGITETVQSPTFVIMKVYKLKSASEKAQDNTFKLFNFQTLFHIDAYRIEKEEEMLSLGWQEIVADPKNLICVEWPERIIGIMPLRHTKINFAHAEDESVRKIEIIK